MKKIGFILPLVILFTSCIVQKEIDIEVLKPAEMVIPNGYRTFVVVDNTIQQPANTGNSYVETTLNSSLQVMNKKGIARTDTLAMDSLGATCVNNAANVLLQSDLSDTVMVYGVNTSDPTKSWDNQMLLPSQVKTIAERSQVDVVLSLDMFSYETEVDFSTWYNTVYNMEAITKFTALWRMYDARTLELVNRLVISDTLYFDIDIKDIDQKAYLEAIVSESAWEAGAIAARKILPWWKKVKRVYFKAGTPGLRFGGEYYEKGENEKAAIEWTKVYTYVRGKDKARAAFNLALYYEMKGDLVKSLEHLQAAKFVYDDSKFLLKSSPDYLLIRSYFEVIETRIKDEEKLKKLWD